METCFRIVNIRGWQAQGQEAPDSAVRPGGGEGNEIGTRNREIVRQALLSSLGTPLMEGTAIPLRDPIFRR